VTELRARAGRGYRSFQAAPVKTIPPLGQHGDAEVRVRRERENAEQG